MKHISHTSLILSILFVLSLHCTSTFADDGIALSQNDRWIDALIVIIILIAIGTAFFVISYRRIANRLRSERETLCSPRTACKSESYELFIQHTATNTVIKPLLNYMDTEKPYLNPSLDMREVSRRLKCSEAELFALLNRHLKVDFYNFVNIYRVNEIKRMLNEENLARYSLRGLAEQCGFSSKSTFDKVFKNITGKTPIEYCRELNLNPKEK